MFESLSGKLGEIFDGLKRRGALSEDDVTTALREVRLALLDADVALPVAKDFIEKVRERAVGQEVLRSVTPGQQVVKIVHDTLVDTLGREAEGINLRATPPAVILMVGLQGTGKTTTSAKIGRFLQTREKKKVMMASLDVQRPAAQEQLAQLGRQGEVDTLPVVLGEQPPAIAKRALNEARRGGYDVLLLDTAGRLHIDFDLMAEVAAVRDIAAPAETLLVADAMTGQDAVNVAKSFREEVGVTGIVLTRVDGDARGGAALSMSAIAECPIKLMGVGEQLDALEAFDAERIANRILGMGDIVGLVEKAREAVEEEEAEALAKKMQKGRFDLEDLAQQLAQLRKMGGMGQLMGMLPGVAKAKKQLAQANMDESLLKRQEAIISSMTPQERRKPDLIKASRKQRIANGSGTSVQDVNRLLKQHKQMTQMMKRASKMGKRGMMPPGLPPGMMPPGMR